MAGFSTNLPAAFANNTFYGDERKGRGVFASRDSNGGSRVIINTGSGEEKCQQAEKKLSSVEDQSVPRCERACNLGGEGRGETQSSVVETRVRGNAPTPCPSLPQPSSISAKKITIDERVLLYSFPSYFQPSQSGRALLFGFEKEV